jgi:acetolactate synthase-1/2/3 large subunit
MVHVDVGTQNLGSMVHNAARGEAGVVIIAGRTPSTAHGEEPGGRDSGVHWLQDVPDQAGVVRPYVKHVADLARPATLVRQLRRAFQVAAAPPAGPVYLTAARETLVAPVPDAPPLPPDRFAPPAAPAANRAELARAARLLAQASRPVIVTTRAGRDPDAVAALVALAEHLGAPVADTHERVNFPSTHPAYLGRGGSRDALARADAVLVVDAPVPWVPQLGGPPDDATVVVLDLDPLHASMPAWSYPVDVALQCAPASGLRDLLVELQAAAPARSAWYSAPAVTPPAPGSDGLATADVATALAELLTPDDIIVEESTTNAEPFRTELARTVPGTYFRSGGSALGWGLGAALGAKLAAPDRRVVSVIGDGAFLFAEPAAALWSMQECDAPVLIVVLRNGGYAASRKPVFDLFPDGRSAATGEVVGTLFRDSPDLAALGRAAGAHGEHVSAREDLAPALRRAVEVVDTGQAAVVVVEVGSPWI